MKTSNNRGVALFMVMGSLALLSILTIELVSTSSVERKLTLNAKERTQAYYLARSGARFALLRLHLWMKAKNELDTAKCGGSGDMLSSVLGPVAQNIDQIWSMPLPALPLEGMKVTWPGKLSVTIESEGSKIPINMLDGDANMGSSPEIKENIRIQLMDLVNNRLEDEDFRDKYRDLQAEDLVNPLVDWIDADSNGQSGGAEDGEYSRRKPPYKSKNARMSSIGELYMLENWNDALVKEFSKHFSLLKADVKVNPNTITLDRIKSFSQDLEAEDLKKIVERRSLSPFKDMKDLEAFIQSELKSGYRFSFPEYMTKDSTTDVDTLNIKSSGIISSAVRTLKLSVKLDREKPMARPEGTPATDAEKNRERDKPLCICGQDRQKYCALKSPQVVQFEESL